MPTSTAPATATAASAAPGWIDYPLPPLNELGAGDSVFVGSFFDDMNPTLFLCLMGNGFFPRD